MSLDARNLWLFGYVDQARKVLQDALIMAKNSNNPRSQANALHHFAFFHHMCREMAKTQELAQTCLNHCNEHGIANERDWSRILLGWVLIEQGQLEEGLARIKMGLASLRVVQAEFNFAFFYALCAVALSNASHREESLATLDEAFEILNRTGEATWEAELYRLNGELRLKINGANSQAEAEVSYQRAIDSARRQSAKSLELRATTSLARLWQQQGKIAEARQTLAEIYGWFTEGFATTDLREARALLEELQTQT